MYYQEGKIGKSDFSFNYNERYDVVYLGDFVVENFPYNHEIVDTLYNEYVFIFGTSLNSDEKSSDYGEVKIDLVRYDQLSNFNSALRERESFHVLENIPLVLNDYLEIVPHINENSFHITAHLKNQKLKDSDPNISPESRNFQVLLLKGNIDHTEHFDNYEDLMLGPEFQAQINYDKARKRYYSLLSTSVPGSNLRRRDPEVDSAVEIVKKQLEIDIKNAEKKKDHAFDQYLDHKKRLRYIHKLF